MVQDALKAAGGLLRSKASLHALVLIRGICDIKLRLKARALTFNDELWEGVADEERDTISARIEKLQAAKDEVRGSREAHRGKAG